MAIGQVSFNSSLAQRAQPILQNPNDIGRTQRPQEALGKEPPKSDPDILLELLMLSEATSSREASG